MNSEEQVAAELQSVGNRLRGRIQEIETELTPLQEELSRLRVQLEYVDRALNPRTSNSKNVVEQSMVGTSTKIGVADRIFEILRTAQQPLHVSEIKRQYELKGWQIPGRGSESNLLVYIVRDSRFVRVSKGTYALAGDGLPSVRTQKTKRKRRRRRKA